MRRKEREERKGPRGGGGEKICALGKEGKKNDGETRNKGKSRKECSKERWRSD